jgi:hypothetical protein
VNGRSPVHLPYYSVTRRGSWPFRMGARQRTRGILLPTEYSTLVDRLTWLTPSLRLTGLNRSLSTTQWTTFTVAVTMPFSLQYPFIFNVKISVSSEKCRYQYLAGFRPRVEGKALGSTARFEGIVRNVRSDYKGRIFALNKHSPLMWA